MSGSMWQGMETRAFRPRRHPLTLPLDGGNRCRLRAIFLASCFFLHRKFVHAQQAASTLAVRVLNILQSVPTPSIRFQPNTLPLTLFSCLQVGKVGKGNKG
jgi:hypothetical protein